MNQHCGNLLTKYSSLHNHYPGMPKNYQLSPVLHPEDSEKQIIVLLIQSFWGRFVTEKTLTEIEIANKNGVLLQWMWVLNFGIRQLAKAWTVSEGWKPMTKCYERSWEKRTRFIYWKSIINIILFNNMLVILWAWLIRFPGRLWKCQILSFSSVWLDIEGKKGD